MLQGSGKINVIPSEASARVDVRLLPGENPAGFLKDLRKVIGDESVKIETVLSFPPVSSPGHPEALRAISTVARSHHLDAVVAMPLLRGFTDCHYFRERGIPCYGFIPIKATGRESSRIHGIDERISVEGFRFGLRMLYEVVHHLVAK
jgi:acetylornithine deacetylase/succinyl-diaminopimelate desuccinylase-like protein